MRVLVVDDDAIFCALAKKKLPVADRDSDVVEAYDGLGAWQIAQSQDFDLALIDLGLPGLDGLSLIERLRHHPKSQQLPIIVITGREDREAIDAAFAAGATFFLTKPINWSLIGYQINCVMRLARSERDAREAHQRSRAESRIKDTVIGRLNYSLRPLARSLAACAQEIAHLIQARAPADAIGSRAAAMFADARRLEDGLANMTVFADAVAVELDLQETTTAMRSLVGALLRDAKPQADSRNVVLKADLPGNGVDIRCDCQQLSRALTNLVANAIRFAPAGSAVVLSARHLDDGSIYFGVDDEGAGIAPDMLVQLLAPLVEVEDAVGGASNLAGMGLAVAKRIAEAHGGTLTIRSAVGRGTTAIVHLPADRILTLNSHAA